MYAGRKLKKLREAMFLTQGQMAYDLEVSQPYYSTVESGKKVITEMMLSKIINKWDVSPEYFKTKDLEKETRVLDELRERRRDYISDNNRGKNRGNFTKNYSVRTKSEDIEVNKLSVAQAKIDKLLHQIVNYAALTSTLNNDFVPKAIRLIKLEILISNSKIVLPKSTNSDFKLILEALNELLVFYRKGEISRPITNAHKNQLEVMINSLDTLFYNQFDLYFKGINPASTALAITNYEDLLQFFINYEQEISEKA